MPASTLGYLHSIKYSQPPKNRVNSFAILLIRLRPLKNALPRPVLVWRSAVIFMRNLQTAELVRAGLSNRPSSSQHSRHVGRRYR
ncbi:hypothetical protein N7509_001181 [Penicillium cosmopolitanum]|uniref:Uncharacterized protein n=1 Tax=Penicillium cosmopolitanum TaxID=1131564 RepID=A0A9W9WCC1_9EURO|nr:uncharacterized protein N7509_001181 [Penicillium cosmopolitanum]KAJ5414554.1 hypothetical protein N7509_001181 [Penicillium cosmopolitanum]